MRAIYRFSAVARPLSLALLGLTTARNQAKAEPQPVSVDFNSDFLTSDDGIWSPAQIQVGNPQQYLQLLPSTVSSETWVIGPDGCDNTVTCFQYRGNVYLRNQSSSWDNLGSFQVNSDDTTQTVADYGLDEIFISNSIYALNQSIAIIDDIEPWLGHLGLSIKQAQYNNGVLYNALISTLVQQQGVIPSHSYGLTAGAFYQGKGVPGSLTLGGVDTTRFIANDLSFALSDYNPIIAITSITVNSSASDGLPSNWATNPLTIMTESQADLFLIDSSSPYLWMPAAVCDSFASALNLTYDKNLDLYVFANNTSPNTLDDWDLTFTFTFADTATSSDTIQLPVSYGAFNLQLQYPLHGFAGNANSAPMNYFPLRRANTSTQYAIGRALLQELYLTVDYERNNFSLSQALFPNTRSVAQNLVPITRPANSTLPGLPSSSLSTGAKVGVAIGVIAGVAAIAAITIVLLIRRRRRHQKLDTEEVHQPVRRASRFLSVFKKRQSVSKNSAAAELLGDKGQPSELQTGTARHELASRDDPTHELDGSNAFEMPATDVPASFYEANRSKRDAIARNQGRPAELERQRSTDKGAFLNARGRSEDPAPAYSPSSTMPQVSESTGSNSISRNGGTFLYGSDTSGSSLISPIGPRLNHHDVVLLNTLDSPVSSSDSAQIRDLQRAIDQAQGSVSSAVHTESTTASHEVERSMSRNSRFHEDLPGADTSSSGDGSPRPSQVVRSRFSWER